VSNGANGARSPAEERVIINKGTEAPFTGAYYQLDEKGVYHCKRCNAPLYRSDDKFDAHCENHNQPGLIHIWPNPASGDINIDCRTIGEPLYYQIYEAVKRLCYLTIAAA
jgi:hypothetical protein